MARIVTLVLEILGLNAECLPLYLQMYEWIIIIIIKMWYRRVCQSVQIHTPSPRVTQ